MSDPSAVPSALGIEAVEWIAEGGETLTVQVTGRWRRRRPAWSGQPTLIVEAPGRRYRFPAMPEPPSLSGAGPGMWRMSFSVPAALAPELSGRSWLQFGSVAVPLPSAIEPPASFATGSDTGSAHEEELVPEPASHEPDPDPEWRVAQSRPEPAPPTAATYSPASTPARDDPAARNEEAEAAVTALTDAVRDLEADLAAARTRADELAGEIGLQETKRRAAQQREHAERALRLDLARQLAARSRESERARQAFGELAGAEARVRKLEAELVTARRRIDEAEQAAAAAVGRRRAEEAAASSRERETAHAAQRRSDAEAARLRYEAALAQRRARTPGRVPEEPAVPAVADPAGASAPAQALASPAVLGSAGHALVTALRAELEVRAAAEAGLRARVADAEARLAVRAQFGRQMKEILTALRRELDGLRAALGVEREARLAAERRTSELERMLDSSRARSRDALSAIGELRQTLASLAPPRAPQTASRPSEVEPERLNEALARLRERAVPPEDAIPPELAVPPEDAALPEDAVLPAEAVPAKQAPAASAPAPPAAAPAPADTRAKAPAPADTRAEPAAPSSPPVAPPAPAEAGIGPRADDRTRVWLAPVFARLVRSEPARAGRLLVDLLPAQGAVTTDPVRYDLLIGGAEDVVRVTAGDGPVQIETGKPARARAAIDFQVVGDHAALARMIVAGRLGRRFGRGVARVRGQRSRAAALHALVGARLDLAELHRLGVRIEPHTALVVIAAMIDPALTARERFSLAYAADGGRPGYLLVRGGETLVVSEERPAGPIAVSIAGPVGTLERVVSGEHPEDATLLGDEWPLALLRKWVKTAQSG